MATMETTIDQRRIPGLSLMDSPPEYTSPEKWNTPYKIFTQDPKSQGPIPSFKRPYQHITMSRAAQPHLRCTPLSIQDTDETPASPIQLRINASVRVCNSDNLICLDQSPADHANAIAKAVVQAIEEHSSGQCGIPMIDEDGHPRPISIDVDAGVTIEGKGNVVGSRGFVCSALARRNGLSKWGLTCDDAEEAAPSTKRPRPSAA